MKCLENIYSVFILLLCIIGINCDHCCQQYSSISGEDIAFQVKSLKSGVLDGDKCKDGFCTREKRYLLYDVNGGEGFNLRRDIFIRISPLIKALNKEQTDASWILVLPPWRNIPHWDSNSKVEFEWKDFFQMDAINEYIPAIEFSQFLQEYGLDNDIKGVFQLQHFPFVNGQEWKEQLKIEKCKEPLPYKLIEGGKYTGDFWGHDLQTSRAECLSLRGQASTLLPFITKLGAEYTSVMLDRAEVLLWDNYGDREWWAARKSLKFAQKLITLADEFLLKMKWRQIPNDVVNGDKEFLGVHLRRRDFSGRNDIGMDQLASYLRKLTKKLKIFQVFLATDAHPNEIAFLESHLQGSEINLVRYSSCQLSSGECAIIDQILCSLASHFVGTSESTFTFRIFEEREILGKSPESTYNYLCPGEDFNNPKKCPGATRWPIQN